MKKNLIRVKLIMTDKKCSKLLLYIAAVVIPAVVMLAVFAVRGIFPFGDTTLMTGDLQYQFIDYFSYLRSILFGNNDFSYTLSNTLGGNMAGMTAYYLASPFAFFMALFDRTWMPAAYSAVVVMACSISSLTMCILLSKLYGHRYDILIFSSGYGLMAYIIVYYQLHMLLVNVAMLPVIVLGIHRLIEDPEKKCLYILALAYAIINNYYTGYMLCIFSVLYFAYRLMIEIQSVKEIRKYGKTISAFVFSSVIAGGMSMFILLPALFSLRGEKNILSVGFFRTCRFSELFSRLYTASFNGDYGACLPNIYCGAVIAFLVILYFFNKNIARRERILTGLFMLFLLLNFYINTFNVAWHGFNQPIGFLYRYSFMLTFLMLISAFRGYMQYEGCRNRAGIIVMAVLYAGYSVFLIISRNKYTGIRQILADGCILAVLIAAVCLQNRVSKKAVIIILMLIQAADLSYSAYDAIGKYDLASLSDYQKYINDTGKAVADIRETDSTLYRTEKYFRRTHNDAMMFDYAGLSHFSSSEKKDKFAFMRAFGFRNNGNWTFYNEGSTLFADCFFGVKYLISQFDTTGKGYQIIYNDSGECVYENNDALPLMFSSDAAVRDVDYEDSDDPFRFQGKLADAITGSDMNIFTPLKCAEKTLSDGSVEFDCSVQKAGLVEMYFTAPGLQNTEIYINDEDRGQYFATYRWNVMEYGQHDKGDTIKIRIASNDGTAVNVTDAYIYTEDIEKIRQFSKEVNTDDSSLEKISSSHYRGNITSSTGCLLFTIPYDDAWSIKIDGRKTEAKKAAGMLLSADITPGTHNVEIKYVPAGRIAGAAISIICVIWLMLYLIISKNAIFGGRNKNKQKTQKTC